MPLNADTFTAIALGIALSAAAGFRIFIPLLGASIASMTHWIQLPPEMSWMGSWPALICFGTAAIAEMAAYYIPFIDNLLDVISTPTAVAAGTLLAYSIFPAGQNEALVKWVLAFIGGGGSAGILQAGTGLLRLFSTKTTAGTGNAVVASGENAAALVSVSLSFVIPIIVASILLFIIGWIIIKIIKRLFIAKQ
jgi:hypothetical protein